MLHLSYHPATRMVSEVPAAARFLNAQELILLSMEHCDIGMPVSWSHIAPLFRHIVQGIIESQIKRILAPFIPHNYHSQFFSVLDKMKSLIAGSTALAAMTPSLNWTPRDVNIIVPRGGIPRWMNLFWTLGYTVNCVGRKGFEAHPHYPIRQRGVASAVVVCFSKPEVCRFVSSIACLTNTLQYEVILIESVDHTPFRPLLHSQLTSQMNGISSSHIYCFYPTLTMERVSFKAFVGDPTSASTSSTVELKPFRRERAREQQLTVYTCGEGYSGPCGMACADID